MPAADSAAPAPSDSRLVNFATSELGIELSPVQVDMLASFEAGDYPVAVWCCGRRGGKSLLADILALADVALRGHLHERMRPGELRVAAVIAPRLDQAQVHIRNLRGLVEASPMLRRMLVGETAESLTFSNNSAVKAYPCSARSLRGEPWSSAVLDEAAWYVDIEGSNNAGDSVLEATWPALSQFGRQGWLFLLSTPKWRAGMFSRMVEDASSGRFRWHYRHHTTAEMNPRIDAEWLAEQQRRDPDHFRREYLGEFVDDIGAYLPPAAVRACVVPGRRALPPAEEIEYRAALDVAYHRDASALVVAHRDQDRVIVDGCWTWLRAGHDRLLDEVAAMLRRYRLQRVVIDQFAEVPVREGLAKRRINADYKPWTNEAKANSFGSMKAAVMTGALELPEDADLVQELCGLEARPTPSGMVRIAAAGSGHDDRATALAAVVASFERGFDVVAYARGYGFIPCERCGKGMASPTSPCTRCSWRPAPEPRVNRAAAAMVRANRSASSPVPKAAPAIPAPRTVAESRSEFIWVQTGQYSKSLVTREEAERLGALEEAP